MQKIMVATDFSERSERAVRRATLLARQFGAELMLVHVVDDDQIRRIVEIEQQETSALLQQMATEIQQRDGVTCAARVLLASSFAGIIQAGEDMNPDLMVIGSHRRQMLEGVFVGTTAERTIRMVDCPVLMVNAPPAGPYRHVMQTTDLSEGSRRALQQVAALRVGEAARNSLLYAFVAPALRLAMVDTMSKSDQSSYLAGERDQAMRDLLGFMTEAALTGLTPLVRHIVTSTHREILSAATSEQADLVVLSTHGRTGLAKLLIGSVTERVLRRATVDILTLPPTRKA